MSGRTEHALVTHASTGHAWIRLTAAAACVLLLNVGNGAAQTSVEAPGAKRPVMLTSPRIKPVPQAEWTEAQRALVVKYAPGGDVAKADNGLRTLLHSPDMVDGLMPYTNYLSNESTLTPRHRELLILRVAWVCASQPLWATHAARAKSAGLSAAEIKRVAEGPDAKGWDPFEATLLRMVDQAYRNSSVSEATWKTLSAQYDMFHMVDAVETAGHFIMLGMMYNAFGVQPDEGFADRPPSDVAYKISVPPREPALTVARLTPVEGRGISVNRTIARHPKLSEKWGPRQRFIVGVSKLPPKQRELLTLRAGWDAQSEYEWAKHVGSVGRARDHGLDPVKIAEGATASVWTPFEKTLIHTVDELYRDSNVSDATWRELTAGLDTPLTMAAVATASDFRVISLSLLAYGVQLEEGDEHFPKVGTK